MQSVPDIFSWLSLSGRSLADLVFFLTAGFAAVTSGIMFFHWRKYALGGAVLALIEILYIGVAAALLAAAFFSLK